jgi:hypothetical protein
VLTRQKTLPAHDDSGPPGRQHRRHGHVTSASWRWVLFVNVPIGIAAALAAPAVLPVSRTP